MTVRELIVELELFAKSYGDNTEVVIDVDEGPTGPREPFISGGPNIAGDPPYVRLS